MTKEKFIITDRSSRISDGLIKMME